MLERAPGRRGSKIEGRGTDAPRSVCLHIGLRGTAAQEGSAATRRNWLCPNGFSGAAHAPLRSCASGGSDEAKSRRPVPAASGTAQSARGREQPAFHWPGCPRRVAIGEVFGLPRGARPARGTAWAWLRGRASGRSSSRATFAAGDREGPHRQARGHQASRAPGESRLHRAGRRPARWQCWSPRGEGSGTD